MRRQSQLDGLEELTELAYDTRATLYVTRFKKACLIKTPILSKLVTKDFRKAMRKSVLTVSTRDVSILVS